MGGKSWSKEDDKILRRMWATERKQNIERSLANRTWKSIQHRASVLGIKRKYIREHGHRKWTRENALEFLKQIQAKYGYVNSTLIEWENTSLHTTLKTRKWKIKHLVKWDSRKHIKFRGKKAEKEAEIVVLPKLGFHSLYRSHNRYGIFDIVGKDKHDNPSAIEVTTQPATRNHLRTKKDLIKIAKTLEIKLYVLHLHPMNIEKYVLKDAKKDESIEWKREGKYRGSGWKNSI